MASSFTSLARLQEAVKLLSAGLAIFTNLSLHSRESAMSREIHLKVLEQERRQHMAALRVQKQAYLMESSTTLEQHFQTLDADLLNSSRESERDMFDQRSQQFQTVILASTVMFTSLTMVIVQGVLPDTTSSALKVAYAITGSLSFSFLFLTIVTSIEVINRASVFMYKRSRKHARNLLGAVLETQTMMDTMRTRRYADERAVSLRPSADLESQPDPPFSSKSGCSEGASSPSEKGRSLLMDMTALDVEQDFLVHDIKVMEYLQRREEIHSRTAVTNASDERDAVKMSFEQFWRSSCQLWGNLALIFFYAGSVNLLLAICVWAWAVFDLQYGSTEGAAIAVALVGSGVGAASALLVLVYCNKLRLETGSWRTKDAE